MNFEYSPGLFGYGIKGNDGSTGIPGAGLFFTNYDRNIDTAALEACIDENRVMWLGADPNVVLSDGRTYKNGDLFIDKDGWLSEIDFTADNNYNRLAIRLSTVSLFEESSTNTQNDFERYKNIDDPSVKYIIDNIYSMLGVYPTLPQVYGINPKNYARIEYSDVLFSNSRNPFTFYSSAEVPVEDDSKALALVRDTQNNKFRFGNLNNEAIRNATLVFDVTSLRKNSSTFTVSTPTQEILSNTEIAANSLFGQSRNVFNYSVSDGLHAESTGPTTANIIWDLFDITPDPCVYGELYLYETSTGSNYHFIPLVFPIEASGMISLNNLKNNYVYDYYIKIIKDGWTRNTITKSFISNGTSSYYLNADPSILNVPVEGLTTGSITLNTNSPTWSVDNDNTSWLSNDPNAGSGSGVYTDSFNIFVAPNNLTTPKIATIEILSYASPKIVTINQAGIAVPTQNVSVEFNDDGNLVFTGLANGVKVNVGISLWTTIYLDSEEGGYNIGLISSQIDLRKNGTNVYSVYDSYWAEPGDGFSRTKPSTWPATSYTINGISNTTTVNVVAAGSCIYQPYDPYVEVLTEQYARITSITFESGTGIATIGPNNQWRSYTETGDCTVIQVAQPGI